MPFNPNDVLQLQNGVHAGLTQRDQVTAAIAAKNAEITRLDAQIATLATRGDTQGVQQQQAARSQLQASRASDLANLTTIDDNLRDTIARLGANFDPCDADPALPLLLLPVRLETRFSADLKQLRVRIYPDDIHIDQLDRGVTDDERTAAMDYWNTVWKASTADADTAWRTLLARAGSTRAAWVAAALTPTNLARRQSDAAPAFPATSHRTFLPAMARLLPDSFTVVALQSGERSQKTGKALAPSVAVSLFAKDGSGLAEVAGLKLHPQTVWTVDYAEAERIGMAVTLDLKRPGKRIDQLFVFGVRRSLEPRQAAPEALRALLESHRYTRGLAFVAQGTPTNNTESDRADWQAGTTPRPPDLNVTMPDARSNASVLAAALGLSAPALGDLDHADDQEQSRARAMNIALWAPSWGTFFEKIELVQDGTSSLPLALREQVRAFHRDTVRARGPLPAVRIGYQPYGVWPVASVGARWKAAAGDGFEAKLSALLKVLRSNWLLCLDSVPRIGRGPIDQTLLELLGASAVSQGLRVRQVLSYDLVDIEMAVTGRSGDTVANERLVENLVLRAAGLNPDLMHSVGSLASGTRPLPFGLVDDSDSAFIDGTVAGSTPTVKSVFQALIALAWETANNDVKKDSANGRLADVVNLATSLPAATRDHVLSVANQADTLPASTLYAEAAGVTRAGGGAAPPSLTEYQPVPVARSSFSELAIQSTSKVAQANLGFFGLQAWIHSRARLAELTAALQELKNTSLSERRLLVAETLDLASHRLDAWITGLVERRRSSLRQAAPVGISIGAYGWVEGIEPTGQRQLDGGFIHAPSLSQAAAAGILRSAYLSHNTGPGGSGAFAVDLTSARVRTARHLAEGVQQAQPLSALLGYRIERALHEKQLDRLVLSLRGIAPLTQGKLTDRNQLTDQAAVEAIAAANVVDGLQLIEKYQGKVPQWNAQQIRNKLSARPANNPYLTGDWQLTDAEWAAVAAIIEDAAAACDAVSDLLLSESVYQLVNGNLARGSAALDAASGGESPVPEPDVIATPGNTVPFSHTVVLIAGNAQPWNLTRPRALAEPRLEGWAAQHLGPAQNIVVAGAPNASPITVADSGLCALDLVYNSGDRVSFMQRLRAALAANLPEARRASLPEIGQFSDAPGADWPAPSRAIGDIFELAASLRAVLVNARPLSGKDLAITNAPTVRSVSAAGLADARQRATKALSLLDVRAKGLAAALQALPATPDPAQAAALAAQLTALLEGLAEFGIAVPQVQSDNLSIVAHLTLAEAQRRVATAQSLLSAASPTAEAIEQAGKALFGEGFWILPPLSTPAQPDGWTAALASAPAGATGSQMRRYLTDLASVRDSLRRFVEALLLAEGTGQVPTLRVAQLCGVGGPALTQWIGGQLDPAAPTPTVPISSVLMDVAGSYSGQDDTVGLVIDYWVDVLPVRERRGAPGDAAAPVDERLASGVAFNAAAPSARAPQVVLLAVSADGSRWTTDMLLDTLVDTLELAKIRLVTLERSGACGAPRVLPALYERSWSLQGERVLDIRFVKERQTNLNALAAFVKE